MSKKPIKSLPIPNLKSSYEVRIWVLFVLVVFDKTTHSRKWSVNFKSLLNTLNTIEFKKSVHSTLERFHRRNGDAGLMVMLQFQHLVGMKIGPMTNF